MSTKKDKGKLIGTQSARAKMRFDSSATAAYQEQDEEVRRAKLARKLAPKPMIKSLGAAYPQPKKD